MKLSEAIRVGSKMRPKAVGEYYDGIGTCALGAAIEGAGLLSSTDLHQSVIVFPTLTSVVQEFQLNVMPNILCPDCGQRQFDLSVAIAHLNDAPHRWSREAIAEWVETLENAEEQKMEKAQEVSAKTGVKRASKELVTT